MKNRGFDIKIWIITALSALFGVGLAAILISVFISDYDLYRTDIFRNCILTILFFTLPLLTAWFGMKLAVLLNRRYEIIGGIGGIRALLISLAACILLAALAQVVYAVEITTEERIIPGEDSNYDGAHIVLLMDCSGSMSDTRNDCDDAAAELIKGLDESNSMQIVAFAANVMDRNISEFLPMTPANKNQLTGFLSNMFAEGGTSFTGPLTIALDTLEANRNPRYRPVIIMLTDGMAEVTAELKARISAFTELSLYSVRITNDPAGKGDNAMTQELIDLADMDFTIPYQSGGSVNVEDVLEAFRAAISDATDPEIETVTDIGFGNDLLFNLGNDIYWWRVLAVFLMFIVYGILLSAAYFGRVGIISILLNSASGCVFAMLFLFLPDSGVSFLLMIPYSFVHLGALTVYKAEGAPDHV